MHPGWPKSYMKAQAYVVHMMKIRIMHSLHVASANFGHGVDCVNIYVREAFALRLLHWVLQQRRTRACSQYNDGEGQKSTRRSR